MVRNWLQASICATRYYVKGVEILVQGLVWQIYIVSGAETVTTCEML